MHNVIGGIVGPSSLCRLANLCSYLHGFHMFIGGFLGFLIGWFGFWLVSFGLFVFWICFRIMSVLFQQYMKYM